MITAALILFITSDRVWAAVVFWPLYSLLALFPAVLLLGGLIAMKHAFQRRADRMRRTYEIVHPRGMTDDQVTDFVRSALGEMPMPQPLRPAYAVSIEKYGDHEGKCYYLCIPGHVSTKLDKLLSKKIDGVSLEPVKPEDDKVRNTPWRQTLEIGMRGSALLRIIDPKHVASSIDANFDDLDKDEALVMQWVVIPDRARIPTPETKDKVSDHTLHAVLRIGATGNIVERDGKKIDEAKQNLMNLAGSFRSVNSHNAKLQKRWMMGVAQRIQRRAGTWGYPIFLNVKEFVALMGWQLDGNTGPFVSRKLAPDKMHDKEGIILGMSNYSKTRGQIIAMPYEAGDMHVRVMGGTGVGKSNFLLHYGLQAMMKPDTAFILLEPAGDLAYDFLCRIPEHRKQDVIYLNPLDTDWPIGLNPLEGSDSERITSHVVSVFRNISGTDAWGPQLQRVLTTAVKTSTLLGLTLYDVKQLLVNEAYRSAQLKKLKRAKYPELFQEWDWIAGKHELTVDSSVNRLDSFLSSRMIRNMVSQRTGLNFDDIIRNHKILIVPLPAARMGQIEASAIGQLVKEMAWNAAMKQDPRNRQRSIVMMDEFQNFADFSTSKSDPFAEARKYKQQYVIANQYTEQLEKKIRPTVDKNVATQIVFRLDDDDAKEVKDRYKPLSAEDLAHLPRYSVAARIMTSSGLAPIVTFTTLPPPAHTGFEHEIIARTRMNYAKPVSEVDADILTRHKTPETKRRPKIVRLEDE